MRLSDRDLEDIGIRRGNIHEVARRYAPAEPDCLISPPLTY